MTSEWRDPAGAKTLVDAFSSALRGEMPTIPPIVPLNLRDAEWRFVCECGATWRATASAFVAGGKVVPPRRPCVGCHKFVAGHPMHVA